MFVLLFRITLCNQVDGVRLDDTELIQAFRKSYPDKNCMTPPKSKCTRCEEKNKLKFQCGNIFLLNTVHFLKNNIQRIESACMLFLQGLGNDP
jgi:hypothetical protein